MEVTSDLEVVHQRCAGMDISKSDAKVCVRTPGRRAGQFHRETLTFGATRAEVLRLRQWLEEQRVELVVMEATGQYWRPFYFVLEETLPVQLVNAKQARNIPGRKSDVSDAAWLATLASYGLLRASFVPPEEIRQLRDLTRTRSHLAQERVREFSRIENELEDTGVKLSVVASDLTTKSCRRMLEAIIAGESDPRTLADLALGSMRKKTPQLIEALNGSVKEHHRFMLRLHLDRVDEIDAMISRLEERIEQVSEPFQLAREALQTIPGISTTIAEAIIAEIGVDMTRFPTSGHLASWAGVCPSQNESAGRVGSSRPRPGNRYLKAALGIAALSASRSKNSYLAARYRRIKRGDRKRSQKALVALERTILVAVFNLIRDGVAFNELGNSYYDTLNPERIKNKAIRQLRTLGYEVEVTRAPAA